MSLLFVYAAALLLALVVYLRRHRRQQQVHAQHLKESVEAGLVEPPSLHPVIDPSRCIGSGSCARACPEEALGVVGGKAVLKNASACIGHGACLTACPVEAIRLVFGTETRGIDDPEHQPGVRDQRAGHLHRRRTRRHGTDPQGGRTGPPGDGRHPPARRRQRATSTC